MGSKTEDKQAVTPQETEPDLPVSLQKSLVEVWSTVACSRVRSTDCSISGRYGKLA